MKSTGSVDSSSAASPRGPWLPMNGKMVGCHPASFQLRSSGPFGAGPVDYTNIYFIDFIDSLLMLMGETTHRFKLWIHSCCHLFSLPLWATLGPSSSEDELLAPSSEAKKKKKKYYTSEFTIRSESTRERERERERENQRTREREITRERGRERKRDHKRKERESTHKSEGKREEEQRSSYSLWRAAFSIIYNFI